MQKNFLLCISSARRSGRGCTQPKEGNQRSTAVRQEGLRIQDSGRQSTRAIQTDLIEINVIDSELLAGLNRAQRAVRHNVACDKAQKRSIGFWTTLLGKKRQASKGSSWTKEKPDRKPVKRSTPTFV